MTMVATFRASSRSKMSISSVFARRGQARRRPRRSFRHCPDLLAPSKEGVAAGSVHLGSMHRAKGLEFKAVFVLACGDTELPNPKVLRH
ncbi:MAG: hypothetical protein KAI47_12570, partial [Deltaproteobacteria bacterium]|nr:hypothetical protein [Deltaproteobacteria bacterium]